MKPGGRGTQVFANLFRPCPPAAAALALLLLLLLLLPELTKRLSRDDARAEILLGVVATGCGCFSWQLAAAAAVVMVAVTAVVAGCDRDVSKRIDSFFCAADPTWPGACGGGWPPRALQLRIRPPAVWWW